MQHLAIIMDGNGRWAKNKGLPRQEGHKAGARAARVIITACRKMGIPHLTLYAFSRENWARPEDEVAFIFDLLVEFLNEELESLVKQSIRLNILGEPGDLPEYVRKALGYVLELTSPGKAMTLNLALNYSGRFEIVNAAKKLARSGMDPEKLDEENFKQFLYTADQPDPDLIIRTSGEYRLSNYLLYQAAYSELYFTDIHWPDFGEEELKQAIEEFGRRNRRYGRVE